MQLTTYVSFNDECEAAFKFYAKCLGAKIEMMMTYAGSPMEEHVSEDRKGKILHARLSVGATTLMASDAPVGRYETPQGFHVTFATESPAEAERVFNALAENGKVTMPLAETFWAKRFGMLVDRFSIPWMINCEKSS